MTTTTRGFAGAAHDGQDERDMSAEPARTSAAAARPREMTTVACACGGAIRGDRLAPAFYVAAHNRGWKHQDWRAAREYGDYLATIALEAVK